MSADGFFGGGVAEPARPPWGATGPAAAQMTPQLPLVSGLPADGPFPGGAGSTPPRPWLRTAPQALPTAPQALPPPQTLQTLPLAPMAPAVLPQDPLHGAFPDSPFAESPPPQALAPQQAWGGPPPVVMPTMGPPPQAFPHSAGPPPPGLGDWPPQPQLWGSNLSGGCPAGGRSPEAWPQEDLRPLPTDSFEQLAAKAKQAQNSSEQLRSLWLTMCDTEGQGVRTPLWQSEPFLRTFLERCCSQQSPRDQLLARVHQALLSEDARQHWDELARYHGQPRVPSGADDGFLRHFLGSIGQALPQDMGLAAKVFPNGPDPLGRRVPPIPPPPPSRMVSPLG